MLIENMLCQDPHIRAAVIFGAGRFQSGAIIDFKSLRGQSSKDEPGQVETLRELIWYAHRSAEYTSLT